jgi:hypothetical protein
MSSVKRMSASNRRAGPSFAFFAKGGRVAQVSPGLRDLGFQISFPWSSVADWLPRKLYPPYPCLTPSAKTVPAIFTLSLLVATTVSLF